VADARRTATPALRSIPRALLAIGGGCLLGIAFAAAVEPLSDLLVGTMSASAPWGITPANVLDQIVEGLWIGFFAGLIMRSHGKLIGVLAYLFPCVAILGIGYIDRVNLGSVVPSNLPFWAAIGSVAALAGGSLGERISSRFLPSGLRPELSRFLLFCALAVLLGLLRAVWRR